MISTASDAPRIGIYGGTFDPVHLGHIHAARVFLESCALDRLYLLPTGVTPHKPNRIGDDPAARLAMLQLAFSDPAYADPRIIVSDYEQRQEGKSYTILTLEHFRHESDALYLLCGTDMFLTLSRWFRGGDILRMVTAVCLERSDDPEAHRLIAEKAEEYRTAYGTRVLLPAIEPIPTSSTEIRAKIAQGDSTEGLLLPAVRDYIEEHHLYR